MNLHRIENNLRQVLVLTLVKNLHDLLANFPLQHCINLFHLTVEN